VHAGARLPPHRLTAQRRPHHHGRAPGRSSGTWCSGTDRIAGACGASTRPKGWASARNSTSRPASIRPTSSAGPRRLRSGHWHQRSCRPGHTCRTGLQRSATIRQSCHWSRSGSPQARRGNSVVRGSNGSAAGFHADTVSGRGRAGLVPVCRRSEVDDGPAPCRYRFQGRPARSAGGNVRAGGGEAAGEGDHRQGGRRRPGRRAQHPLGAGPGRPRRRRGRAGRRGRRGRAGAGRAAALVSRDLDSEG
jgi:hypothetical protein